MTYAKVLGYIARGGAPDGVRRVWQVDVALGLGVTPDLDPADVPWVSRGGVVDDERRAAGRLDVAELARRPQRNAADRDIAVCCCGAICCPRRISRRESYVMCAICCVIARRWWRCAPL
jgi:hypothetical protein